MLHLLSLLYTQPLNLFATHIIHTLSLHVLSSCCSNIVIAPTLSLSLSLFMLFIQSYCTYSPPLCYSHKVIAPTLSLSSCYSYKVVAPTVSLHVVHTKSLHLFSLSSCCSYNVIAPTLSPCYSYKVIAPTLSLHVVHTQSLHLLSLSSCCSYSHCTPSHFVLFTRKPLHAFFLRIDYTHSPHFLRLVHTQSGQGSSLRQPLQTLLGGSVKLVCTSECPL